LTRCPSCGATVPAAAGWCSLCHHDLRPAPEPTRVVAPSSDVVPGVDPVAPSGRHRRRDEAELDEPEPLPAPPPRRSRARTSSAGGGGRHASSGRRVSRSEAALLSEGYSLQGTTIADTAPDPEREEVERLADSMLSRLAVAEQSEALFDPSEVPGGRWGFAAAMAGVLILVILLGSVVVNAIVNR
jgi:hypothetical protein